MALPNLGVVGFPKCGSTTIYHEFRAAPDIHTSVVEETTAFTGPAESENSIAMLEAKFYGSYKAQRYLADIHPALVYSRADLERMRRVCGEMKIICLMREPLARSFSNYRHAQRWLAENRSLEEAFDADIMDPVFDYQFDGRTLLHHVSLSRYEVFIPRLWEIFGKENVLCLQFENFFGGDLSERARLMKFLQLRPDHYPPAGESHRNAGSNWNYVLQENITLTVDGQQVHADRFAAVGDSQTDKIEWFVVNPSDASWAWFEKAKRNAEQNTYVDFNRYYDVFEDTLAFCEEEVFGRALPEWRQRKLAKAA